MSSRRIITTLVGHKTDASGDDYAQEVLKDNPTGWWRMNDVTIDSAVDSSGYGVHGAYGPGTLLNLPGPGLATCMEVRGTDAYLDVVNATLPGGVAKTVEMWVYMTDITASNAPNLSVGAFSATQWLFHAPFMDFNYYLDDRENGDSPGSRSCTTGGPWTTNGRWHQVVGVASTGKLDLWLDGILIATNPAHVLPVGSQTHLLAGVFNGVASKGRYADISTYDHALTGDRINAHRDAMLGIVNALNDSFTTGEGGSIIVRHPAPLSAGSVWQLSAGVAARQLIYGGRAYLETQRETHRLLVDSRTSDGTITVRVMADGNTNALILFRTASELNLWQLNLSAGGIALQNMNAGVYSVVTWGIAIAPDVFHTVVIELAGPHIHITIDGTISLAHYSTTHATVTKHGIGSENSVNPGGVQFEFFKVSKSPLMSRSPLMWLDGSDASTMFTDPTATVLSTPGGPVGAWLDKSGNGNHLFQSTPAACPTLAANYQNGKSALQFANTQYLSRPSIASGTSYAFFCVFRLTALDPSSTAGGIAYNGNPGANGFGLHIAKPDANPANMSILHGGRVWQDDGLTTTNLELGVALCDPGAGYVKMRRNRVEVALNVQAPPFDPSGQVYIGGGVDAYIMEVLLYPILAPADYLAIESFLVEKWAIVTTKDLPDEPDIINPLDGKMENCSDD